MVVITVGTVGFGEKSEATDAEKILTIIVILLGVTVVAYIFAGFVQMLTAGEIRKALGQRRMNREIESLSGHVILCGIGRVGELLAEELTRQQAKFVIIDRDVQRINDLTNLKCLT